MQGSKNLRRCTACLKGHWQVPKSGVRPMGYKGLLVWHFGSGFTEGVVT
jgi:hypothetical protein